MANGDYLLGMKLILTKKGKAYVDAAILIEPLGNLEGYSERQFVGVSGGVVSEMSEALPLGTHREIYDLAIPVRYQLLTIHFLRSQMGKKIRKARFWQKWFRSSEDVQSQRKHKGVWDAAELVFAALVVGKYPLFRDMEPHEMSVELLTKSSHLFLVETVTS